MYELIKSTLFLTGLLLLTAALILLLPQYINISALEQGLIEVIGS